MQHKWHKEIKAWADGAEIEFYDDYNKVWEKATYPAWYENDEYRIKPQPKELQCKTHPNASHGFCRDASHSKDRYVCECEFWEEPKEQQYLYVYQNPDDGIINLIQEKNSHRVQWEFIGKIKLENENAG